MSRYRSYGGLDDAESIDGDDRFLGVNTRLDPSQLPPGIAAHAKNKRFNRGVAETRKGIIKLRWANRIITATYTEDITTDELTVTAGHGFQTGDPVSISSTTSLCSGLSPIPIYFVRVITTTTFTLHQTAADAVANTNKINLTSASSGTLTVKLERPEPYRVVYGAGEFYDIQKQKWMIVAADGKVYRHKEDHNPVELTLPAGVTINTEVRFIQIVNDLVMLRGANAVPLKMSSVDVGFATVTKQANTIKGASTENPSDGTIDMPNASIALSMGNRLLVLVGDLVYVSDFLNYTRFQPVRSVFRVYQGVSGDLTGIFKFDESTILLTKERAVYRVGNLTGNLSTAYLDEITREYGVTASKSFAQVGADVWFLADRRGVCSIRRTDEGKLQAVDIPASYELHTLVNRINWRFANKSVAAYHDNKFYLAVPLDSAEVLRGNILPSGADYDGSGAYSLTVKQDRVYRWTKAGTNLVNGTETLTADSDFTAQGSSVTLNGTASATITATVKPVFKGVNNAVLVYDFLNQKWSGYDTCKGDDLAVFDWVKHPYNGSERLYFLGADGFLNLYEEGFEDELPDAFDVVTTQPIEDELLSRGYLCGSIEQKRFTFGAAQLSTWTPKFSIAAQFDGVNESKSLKTDVTKSRVKYFRPFDKADWDKTNVNDDHVTAYREDYSVTLDDAITRSGSIVAGSVYLAERTPSGAVVAYNSGNYTPPSLFTGVTGVTTYTPTDAVVLSDTGYIDPTTSGFDPDLHQEFEQPIRIGRAGKYAQFKITNTQGRCEIRSIKVSALATDRDLNVKG